MIQGKKDVVMEKGKFDEAQLSLEFKSSEIFEPTEPKAKITLFIDGPTRRLRHEAIHRVSAAGIFTLSARLKSR